MIVTMFEMMGAKQGFWTHEGMTLTVLRELGAASVAEVAKRLPLATDDVHSAMARLLAMGIVEPDGLGRDAKFREIKRGATT